MNPPATATTTERRSAAASLLERHIASVAARLWQRLPDEPVLDLWMRRGLDADPADPFAASAAAAELAEILERELADPRNANDPLAVLAGQFRLSPFEIDLLLIAAMPAIDERFGDLFERLTRGRRRLRLGEAFGLLTAHETDRLAVGGLLRHTSLFSGGMLRDCGTDAGFERLLDATPTAVALLQSTVPEALADGSEAQLTAPRDGGSGGAVHFQRELGELVEAMAAWVEESGPGVVHAVTSNDESGPEFAAALAAARGLALVSVHPAAAITAQMLREAALLARAAGALLLVDSRRAPVEAADPTGHAELRLPERWQPPALAVLCSDDRWRLRAPGLPARRIDLPAPGPASRVAAWRRYLGEVDGKADVELLACRTHLSVDDIRRACRLAAERARLEGRDAPHHDDTIAALRELSPDPISPLATTYHPNVPWERVVLGEGTRRQIDDVVARVRLRGEIDDGWGMRSLGRRGDAVVGLLHGPSGVGKSLVAEAIATRLQLPIVIADLARIVSKYIGETEKNLSELFALAEGFRALLLFDEADALFGKRTSVRDAHDRYANIEVNFLLQRLETFEGISLLCTNLMNNTDEALLRRLQFSVHMPRPSAGEQILIWRQHLPGGGRVSGDVDIETIVSRFDLVGGDICNAAKAAAYAAAADGGVITHEILLAAVRAELKKRGRPVPRK